jgi:hypothetical protein
MSFAGPVPTTRVNLSMDGRSRHSENWMVFDSGHTLSPNAELLQGKLMHWVEHMHGKPEVQSYSATGELAATAAPVGYSYRSTCGGGQELAPI